MILSVLRVFLFLIILLGLQNSRVWASEPRVREAYNAAIEAVVKDILQMKSGYPELEGFSQSVVSQDTDGFYKLLYVHDSSGTDPNQDPYNFSLAISIKRFDPSEKVNPNNSRKDIDFPLLGVKVVVETQRLGVSTSFDATRIIESNMNILKDLDQELLPFQLDLKAQKNVFGVYEDIVIKASLTNLGSKAFRVANIDENSLYCTIGNTFWGSTQSTLDLRHVLNPKTSIATILTIPGFDMPQDVWVSCQYAIAFKGIRPYKRIKISIKSNS